MASDVFTQFLRSNERVVVNHVPDDAKLFEARMVTIPTTSEDALKSFSRQLMTLSHLEYELLLLDSDGLSTVEIADELGVTTKLLDDRRKTIGEKLGNINSVRAVRLLFELKAVSIDY